MAAEILCKVKSNFWNHQIFVQLFTSFSFSPQTFYRLICWKSLFPESECKGIANFYNLQIFQQLFSIKISHFHPLQSHRIAIQAITPLTIFFKFPVQILSIQNQSPKLQTYSNPTRPAAFEIHRTTYIEKIAGFHISKPCETNNRNQLKVYCLPAISHIYLY